MKRRCDYILEKLNLSNKNHNNAIGNENHPLMDTQDKSDCGDIHVNLFPEKEFDKENISENNNENITTQSASIIEESLNGSIPYFDPKTFLTQNIDEVQTEIRQPRQTKHSSTSSSSSSSRSSSSSTSSSSSISDDSNSDARIIIPPSLHHQPSTSKVTSQAARETTNRYYQSSINSNESDADLSDSDPNYTKSSSSSSSEDTDRSNTNTETITRSRKRVRDPTKWKQNVAKKLRNTGKPYVSTSTKKEVPGRFIKDACKCKLKCADNITDTDRNTLFETYWSIGDIQIQRAYIRSCMTEIKPKYRYTNADRPRLANHAFYFVVQNIKIRVCKTFFLNTLCISDRQVRTVKKKTDPQGFVVSDKRGKCTSRKPINPAIIESIKQHINSIPRIESHYLRASTSREYISGEKTIMDLWKDYVKFQKEEGGPTCDYWLYYNVLTKEFNIGFFQPKKDRCDLCLEYELAAPERKNEIKIKYDDHIKEKDLCRNEKRADRENINENNICAVYDLQAVMQCPTCFFYKSKLNCLDFTVVELLKKSQTADKRKTKDKENQNETGAYDNVYCYFWDEVHGNRGANEIGSCVLNYLQRLNEQNPNKKLNVTFYSDNCCGQNKNKFIASLYSYAVTCFENIDTITHKYLIKGHTQNEGDNVHSLIEKEIKRNKKAGPIYTPHQYVTLIKNSRRNGKPFNVMELTYDFFIDLKDLQNKWGYNYNEDEHKNNILWNNIKVLKFCKEDQFVFYFKTSYEQTDFTQINMRNKRKKMLCPAEITLKKAFSQRLQLNQNKKKDLCDLVNKNLIPSYYVDFYKSIL